MFCLFHDCIYVFHRSGIATASELTHEELRETISAVKDMAGALKDAVQKKAVGVQPAMVDMCRYLSHDSFQGEVQL